jgi:transcriptional regulator with XRE-family HTH domain
MSLGENIRAFREREGLTQQQLGERCGVDGSTVSYWESGKNSPRAKMLAKLATELSTTVGELYGEAA